MTCPAQPPLILSISSSFERVIREGMWLFFSVADIFFAADVEGDGSVVAACNGTICEEQKRIVADKVAIDFRNLFLSILFLLLEFISQR